MLASLRPKLQPPRLWKRYYQFFHPAEANKLVQHKQPILFRLLRAFTTHGHAENDVSQQRSNRLSSKHVEVLRKVRSFTLYSTGAGYSSEEGRLAEK